MNTTAIEQKLDGILKLLLKKLNMLSQLLEDEQQALHTQNFEEINSTAEKKQHLTHNILQLKKNCQQLLSQYKLPADPSVFINSLGNTVSATQLHDTWRKILYVSEMCENKNNVNGIIIRHMQSRTEQVLSILYGNITQNEIYSASGEKQHNPATKILAQA